METEHPHLCRLEEVRGRKIVCPEDECAFWEPGGAVLEGRCVLAGIDFAPEPGLADWLVEFRDALAAQRAHSGPGHEFRRVLSQGRE